MKTRTIKQTVTLYANPDEIFEMFMDTKKYALFTGGKAHISREIGGTFTTNDGYSIDVNVELIPNRKIVQPWRANE